MYLNDCCQQAKHYCLKVNSLGWFNKIEKRKISSGCFGEKRERVKPKNAFKPPCATLTATISSHSTSPRHFFMVSLLRYSSSQLRSIHNWNSSSHGPNLLTIAIETSCDDTSVAVLEKNASNSAILHFHSRITSDNRAYGGIHPLAAHESHQKTLAGLLNLALEQIPEPDHNASQSLNDTLKIGNKLIRKPHFITATRGPGMRASLTTGFDTAKGLAVGLQIPLLGVNHMQAHALTPRLVSAINASKNESNTTATGIKPEFPYLSLLVSGGHTLLALSRSIWDHTIIANTNDLALGDMLDKSARAILPTSYISQLSSVMYGRALEEFTFPESSDVHSYTPPKAFPIARNGSEHGYTWKITPPYISPGPEGRAKYFNQFSFSGIGSKAINIMVKCPNMLEDERRCLAKTVMTVAFEHLGSRVHAALNLEHLSNVKVLVVSGGVASNRFLRKVLRTFLDTRGFSHIELLIPSPELCTDNAAMIAWTGIEMFEAGFATDLSALALKQWSVDPKSDDGGILGVKGWIHGAMNWS
ncbi:putative glycoprotease family protein [Erysiphe necator]|uniref:N(6)-L-threonylcarbamoyladenine synthase n=1 Tax=Uncinula necator TaxID=52586 RepID=A0A0B1P9F1_UNCNE|nr:putative glycoprotease family protein [Erysiphe necator]